MAGANPNPGSRAAAADAGSDPGGAPPSRAITGPEPGTPVATGGDVLNTMDATDSTNAGNAPGSASAPDLSPDDPAGSRNREAPPDEATLAEAPGRTWTVLIAALGGEGGGVLSNWLVDAASEDGRTVQATSVPGVAQRTGATTYYLEIGSRRRGGGGGDDTESGRTATGGEAPPEGAPAGSRPGSGGRGVMALLPTPGNVDLLVASELLEAGRAAQNGMITPERTTVIASTHRMFAIAEKSAMGDGRFNDERVRRAVQELSRRHVLTDLGKVAERAGTVLSSVLLGAIAGSGALPISRERLRGAIDRAGIAVEANQRGFDAGYRLFEDEAVTGPDLLALGIAPKRDADAATALPDLPDPASSSPVPSSLAARLDALPEPVREFACMGVARAVDYQDPRYGALYLDRIERLLAEIGAGQVNGVASAAHSPSSAAYRPRPEAANGAPGAMRDDPAAGHAVAREVARHLALWMCFEDLIRVADLKTRRARIERVRAEVRAKPGQPVAITEFLKPGVDEWCSVLPGWLARPILRAADRGGWRRRLNVGLHVRTSSVSGFLLMWTLARLGRLRRGMHRFREEQRRIEMWLVRVGEAYATSPALAVEVAKCANLVKGYGDTHERGVRNFERAMACLAACAAASDPGGSLRALREAALADPDGGRLDDAIAALEGRVSPASG